MGACLSLSTSYLVGTGGWAYFPANEKAQLKAYSKVFNFVEVNYTFYEYPARRTVERWKRTVPEEFTFSVRCHQDLTHRIGLRPTEEAHQILNQMLAYCKILRAPFLVLETPPNYKFSSESVKDAEELFTSAKLGDTRIVWENRSPLIDEAKTLMQDLNIIHSVDLSVQEPLFPSDAIYTRLFGKGKHNIYQFSDEELEEIAHKILTQKPKIAAMSYHGLRMTTDAIRFINYLKNGEFPQITPYTGAESAKTVLAEDARFPTSKQALIDDQGWKVFDATKGSRIHLSEWLTQIPNKTYNNLNEVIAALEAAT